LLRGRLDFLIVSPAAELTRRHRSRR